METNPNDTDGDTLDDFIIDRDAAGIDDSEGVETTSKKSRPVWPFVLLLGALLGFGASYAASYYTLGNTTEITPFDPAPLRAELAELRTELDSLRNRPVPAPTISAPAFDPTALQRRLDVLEARPEPEPIDDALVTRLEALQANGFEIPDLPEPVDLSVIEARLAALEDVAPSAGADLSFIQGQIDVLDTRVTGLEEAPRDGPDVGALRAEIDSLRVALNDPATLAATSTNPRQPAASLPSFPAQRLRDGANEMDGGGLLSRTLSKHVRVKGADDPITLIDQIEADMRAGNAAAAVATFDRLPSQLRSLATAWRADMERFAP